MTPRQGNTFLFRSSQQLPRRHLGPLKGFLSWHGTLQGPSPRALLPELQRYKDTVRCGALCAEVPGHRQEQLTQTLIVHSFKTHLFLLFQKLEQRWVGTLNRSPPWPTPWFLCCNQIVLRCGRAAFPIKQLFRLVVTLLHSSFCFNCAIAAIKLLFFLVLFPTYLIKLRS